MFRDLDLFNEDHCFLLYHGFIRIRLIKVVYHYYDKIRVLQRWYQSLGYNDSVDWPLGT